MVDNRIIISAIVGILIVGTLSVNADSLVVKTGDTIDGKTLTGILFNRSLSDTGEVFFTGFYDDGFGVFTQDSLVIQTGDIIDGKTLKNHGNSAVNDNGELALVGIFTDNSKGIIFQNNLVVNTGDTLGGVMLTDISAQIGVNNSGEVAFHALFNGGSGVFTQDSLLVKTGDIIDSKTVKDVDIFPSINNDGNVVFTVVFVDDTKAIILSNPNNIPVNSILAKPGDEIAGLTFTNFGFSPDINNNGEVAFNAFFSGGHGLFTQDHLILRTGDTIDGRILTNLGGFINLNDNGKHAFLAGYSGGSGNGILTQDRLLLEVGDLIDGKEVSVLGNPNMNNNGLVAVLVDFTDGTRGIYLIPTLISVDIDITPGSEPNCISEKKKGQTPIAIKGSAELDITTIDQSTIQLDDDDDSTTAGISPTKITINDVDGDGNDDLVLKFKTTEMKNKGFLVDNNELFVTGELNDDTPIIGSNIINLAGGPNCS